MNQKFFPKPPPADPLPLEVWFGDTDRSEVGREPFFRGRDTEYEAFQNAASMLKAGRVGGGTMIFQGAPGAGKTALMKECMEAVRLHSTPEDPWVAISMGPAALMSATGVVMIMIEEANRERKRLLERFPKQIPRKFEKLKDVGQKLLSELANRGYTVSAGGLEVTMHGKSVSAHNQEDILAEQLFRDVAPLFKDIRMVIFVDEAQNTPVSEPTKAVMDCLHRDTKGIPLIAAFFGLSDTESVLVQCGLSRPARRRVLSLGTLSEKDAKCAIQSVFDTYGFNGSDQQDWIDALADLSQNWPQHISSVSFAAGRVICGHGGKLNQGLLPQALNLGRELKEEYYASRLRACTQDLSVYKQVATVLNEKTNGTLSRSQLRSLTAPLLLDSTTFDDFLSNALHAGILMEEPKAPQYFKIPIPSFGDYLRALLDD